MAFSYNSTRRDGPGEGDKKNWRDYSLTIFLLLVAIIFGILGFFYPEKALGWWALAVAFMIIGGICTMTVD